MALSDIFSTRELSWMTWGPVILVVCLCFKSGRKAIRDLSGLFFGSKIFAIWLLMVFYIAQFTFYLWYWGLWTSSLLKDTVFFVLFSASVTFFKANKIDQEKHFFKEMVKDALKFGIILEFLIGLYTFSFITEFLVIPFGVLLGGMLAVAGTDEKYSKVKKLINTILTVAGLYLIYHVIVTATQHYKELFIKENLVEFLFSPVYTLLFIPFLYLLSMHMVYEVQHIVLDTAVKPPALKALARKYAFRYFRNDLDGLKRWVRRVRFDNPQTPEELLQSIKDLKNHLEIEKAPPVVPITQGWSPYAAINFMDHEKLKTGPYDRAYDNEWGACSNYLYIGDSILSNTLSYYVNGNETTATSLDLALKVFQPNEPADLHVQFLQQATLLFAKATGGLLPQGLAEAIIKGKPKFMNFQHFHLELKKERWLNHTNGYDLILTISTPIVQ